MKTSSYLLSFFLSFVLCITLLAVIIISVIMPSVFSTKNYLNAVEKEKVCDIIYDEIHNFFIDQSGATNIPPEVYEGVVSSEEISTVFKKSVESVMNNIFSQSQETEKLSLDFSKLEKNLSDYFNKFANENNLLIDEAFEKQLSITIESAKSDISEFLDISLLEKVGEKVSPYIPAVKKWGTVSLIAALLLSALISTVILFLSRRHSLFWILSALASTSLLAVLGFTVLRFGGILEGFIFKNKIMHAFITGFLKILCENVLIVSLILLVISVLALIAYILKIKRENYLQNTQKAV